MKYIHNGTDQVFALYNAYTLPGDAWNVWCPQKSVFVLAEKGFVLAGKGFCAGRTRVLYQQKRGFVLAEKRFCASRKRVLCQQKRVDNQHLHEMLTLWFRATNLLLAVLLFLCLLLSQFSTQLSIQPLLLLQSHGNRAL